MKDKLIQHGLVFYEGKFEKRDLRICDGVFCACDPEGKLTATPQEEVIDAEGKYILPGLVDIHSHGRVGEDFNFATKEGLQKMCDSYAACGVTSVLATTMTNEPSAIAQAMKTIGEYRTEHHTGARLQGIHMEGPFLGVEKKGAHDEQYLRPIDLAWFEEMQHLSKNSIRIVSVDPTLSGAMEFIRDCKEKEIVVSLAHTASDYETAVLAAKAGANHVTHLFNAMNPLHHRKPGLVGAAFDCELFSELICDGIHLHPSVIRMMFAMKPERMLLISDSMQAAGLADGEYELGGLKVWVKDKKATLADGTIAGSTTDVYSAMVNAIRFGVPVKDAVASATILPAESAGLSSVTGTIATGRQADFLVVSGDWKLENVFISGESCSSK